MKSQYSATLTGNPFLFFETRLIAGCILQGQDKQAIASAVLQENLFQYRSTKSIQKRVNAILRRLEDLDKSILERLTTDATENGKLIVLLIIARSDLLFREFLVEVVQEKLRGSAERLSDGDLNRFFETKAEISPIVAGWTESAVKKLRQIYVNIMINSGLLKDRADRRLQRPIIDDDFKRILIRVFGSDLVRTIGGR